MDFDNVVNNDSFFKNIKRMFIIKQMEIHNIKSFNITFDNNIKKFKFELIKDDQNKLQYDYKIKRNKKRDKENMKQNKKIKLNNDYIKVKEDKKGDEKDKKYCNSFKSDFESKINSSTYYIFQDGIDSNKEYFINKNNIINKQNLKNIREEKSIRKEIKNINNINNNIADKNNKIDQKLNFKYDQLCIKLYKHIICFIKDNNIKNIKESKNIKKFLFDIETVFKTYGF